MNNLKYLHDCQKAVRLKFDISHFKNPTAATLTLKQSYCPDGVNHFWLTPIEASSNLRHFRNLLDRDALGKTLVRKKHHIPCYAVLEGNAYQYKRYHFHLCLDRPDNVGEVRFDELINDCWRKTNFGYRETYIVHQCDSGFIDYITKFDTKERYLDSIDWTNCYFASEAAV